MRDLLSVLAIVVGLAITPVLASDFQVSRPETADVVANSAAYVSSATPAVRLCLGNGYEANALSLTHRYTGSTRVDVTSFKKSGAARFTLTQATGSINAGQTHNIRVRDNDGLHTSGTFPVVIVGNATLVRTATDLGFMTHERTISVTVAFTC